MTDNNEAGKRGPGRPSNLPNLDDLEQIETQRILAGLEEGGGRYSQKKWARFTDKVKVELSVRMYVLSRRATGKTLLDVTKTLERLLVSPPTRPRGPEDAVDDEDDD